jgi:hypothetical protein
MKSPNLADRPEHVQEKLRPSVALIDPKDRRASALASPPAARIHLPALAFPWVTCGEHWQKYMSVSRNDGIASIHVLAIQ